MKQELEEKMEQVLEARAVSRLHQLMRSRMGLVVVSAISFLESALPIPIITDPFMVAAILVDRRRTFLIVSLTIIFSILGGIAAFSMAAYFFDIISTYMTNSMRSEFDTLREFSRSDIFITTLTGAVTPIPYTITAWVVAVAGGGVGIFIAASVIGRGVRYAIVGYCAYLFGPAAITYARRSLLVTSCILFCLVAVYIWIKL